MSAFGQKTSLLKPSIVRVDGPAEKLGELSRAVLSAFQRWWRRHGAGSRQRGYSLCVRRIKGLRLGGDRPGT